LHEKWFRKNVRVEVEGGKEAEHYGESGIVTNVDEKAEQLSIITDKVGITVKISQVALRTERECLTRPYFNFSRLSDQKLTLMLHQLGQYDPAASAPLESISISKPVRLEDQHLRLFSLVLSSTFPTCQFRFFDAQYFMRRAFGEHDEEEVKEELFQWMRSAMSQKPKLFFPIHCDESEEHPLGHWTLLVIESAGKHVRYYDTLNSINEICLSKATKILSVLGLDQNVERTNMWRQKGDECCEAVMHYFELEVRHLAGEGWGTVRNLHPEHRLAIRNILKRFQENLEKFRRKWCNETQIAELKEKSLKEMIQKQIPKDVIAQIELDKLRGLAEAVGQLSTQHKDLPGLILPAPKPVPKLKARKPRILPKPSEVEEVGALEVEKDGIPCFGGDESQEPSSSSGGAGVQEPALSGPAAFKAQVDGMMLDAQQELLEQDPVEVPEQSEDEAGDVDQVVLEKLDELQQGEKGFNQWVWSLTEDQKNIVIKHTFGESAEYHQLWRYVAYVKSTATFQGCAKCRYFACEKCDASKAQNYVLRHGTTPSWWNKLKKACVQGCQYHGAKQYTKQYTKQYQAVYQAVPSSIPSSIPAKKNKKQKKTYIYIYTLYFLFFIRPFRITLSFPDF